MLATVPVTGHVARRVVRFDGSFSRQYASHVGRAVRVALLGREVSTGGLLEVSRLRKYHQFIECVYTEPREEFQTGPQPHGREQIHQFLEG
jgi:hypothetical protein